MYRRFMKIAAAALLLGTAAAGLAARPFALRGGDRVVFYGDSITDQRLYTTFVETYVVTRFPRMKVDFTHSGWGGDRVTGGGGGPIDMRLSRDVLAYRPTVMTIMLGMNDGSYRPFDEGIFKTYADGYRQIVKRMKAECPGVRITAIRPSAFDDVTRSPGWDPGYNSVLVRYGEFLQELASSEGLGLADQNGPLVSALIAAKEADAANAAKIVPDRVHPGAGGHLIMAAALLKAWDAPAIVSEVEIDGGTGRVVNKANTSVSAVTHGAGLAWTQLDGSLPMPIDTSDPVIALSAKSAGLFELMDRQPLKVTGLTAERYVLKIDGEYIAELGRDELATGVNLATLATPMAKQAAQVHELTLRHNQIHFVRWRQVQVPYQSLDSARMRHALAGIDDWEQEIVAQQRKLAQPVSHRFELSPK